MQYWPFIADVTLDILVTSLLVSKKLYDKEWRTFSWQFQIRFDFFRKSIERLFSPRPNQNVCIPKCIIIFSMMRMQFLYGPSRFKFFLWDIDLCQLTSSYFIHYNRGAGFYKPTILQYPGLQHMRHRISNSF